MSELKHWLDEASEADDFERSILRSGLERDPPRAKQDQVWDGLMATLAIAPLAAVTASPPAAAASAAATSVGKAGAVWLAVAKGFIVGLAVYGAAQGVSEVSNRIDPRRAPTPTAQQATISARPSRVMSRDAERSFAEPVSSPVPSAPSGDPPSRLPTTPRSNASVTAIAHGSPNPGPALPSTGSFDDPARANSARISQLEAETLALRQARAELRVGKLTDAFATLEAARRQFPAPELYQEREALTIELLYRSGQVAAAEQRARAFLIRFPESPHAHQIRQFAAR